ncbi:hypothetical protein SAMN04488065_0574 [Haloplanus vescus]|uniref:Uncharacterized protein n=1 Tax=Haloplanus vescus TaxID=555874 RepID=A0A1H3W773_9EURY|nr:hypothetical protein [Haloplanus vescus]SDZ82202.1 hypothetical protein SAMN04488065_0574 [Haloplanus vescus]
MSQCPECGKEEEFETNVKCKGCYYTYRYDDRADYDPEDYAFTVKFRCMNCGREFKHGFGKGDEVRPKNSTKRNFQLDEVNGNPYIADVDGARCQIQCPTCDVDHSLTVVERTPVREG